jgi:hypothetical protein
MSASLSWNAPILNLMMFPQKSVSVPFSTITHISFS